MSYQMEFISSTLPLAAAEPVELVPQVIGIQVLPELTEQEVEEEQPSLIMRYSLIQEIYSTLL